MCIAGSDVGSCDEVQQVLRAEQDGEYLLTVAGRQLRVYCHAMQTSEPREFIREGGEKFPKKIYKISTT